MANVFVLYQFLHPDSVVSSVLVSQLCGGLVQRGWSVHAFPSNRSCHDPAVSFAKKEEWEGVHIHRIWRPAWPQASGIGRVFNAIWMLIAWTLLAIRRGREADVLIIGTDPILSVSTAVPWRLFSPRTKIVHWCFDLYPEAAIADGRLSGTGFAAGLFKRLARSGYKRCDVIADIGSCMRERLSEYENSAENATLAPWALAEVNSVPTSHGPERDRVFGDVTLALMYSGSFGRAHSYEDIFALVRSMKDDGVKLALSVQGNRQDELVRAISHNDSNIILVPFADFDSLSSRLAAADIHVITLRKEWTGMVVPSKFFGALAMGRPVIFCGPEDSAIARWIRQFKVGWVLSPGTNAQVAQDLRELVADQHAMSNLRSHCWHVYTRHFSRNSVINAWDEVLREVTGQNRVESLANI